MKFSALEEYGLRCILHLARDGCWNRPGPEGSVEQGHSLTIGEIAQREGLTQQYAGKIFRVLARSGLVSSERGRKGGYRLAHSPEELTLSRVLTALGGRIFDRRLCGRYKGDRPTCVHTQDCSVRSLWAEIQRIVDHVLEKTTLKDLLANESRAKETMREKADDWMAINVEKLAGMVGPPTEAGPDRPSYVEWTSAALHARNP